MIMKNKNKEISFKIVSLDNKSRKGEYIYIKETGKRPSYYKYDSQFKIDYYLKYYNDKKSVVEKRKGLSVGKHLKVYQDVEKGEPYALKKKEQVRSEAERYLKKIKKQYGGKTLDNLLKKGIQAVVIDNVFKANQNTIFIANKKLISDIVLDKKIQDLMATEENMKKLSNRLEQRIAVIGEGGKVLAEFNVIGKTTNKTVSDLNLLFKKGEEWKKTGVNSKTASIIGLGYNKPENKEEGTIVRIQLTTILRKAK